jgi:hypothetical protein
MKTNHTSVAVAADETPIASFGEATLIKKREGSYVLQGGSRADLLEAHEWISLFLHEVVVSTAYS